jgi:hypothetical protein
MPPTRLVRELLAARDTPSRRMALRSVAPAIVDLSREYPPQELSRRLVADRAGTSYLEVCAHFASVEAMIAETCLDALHQSPLTVEFGASARERMVGQFHQLIMLLAYEPCYGAACVWALMSNAESVRPIRTEIDAEIRRRVSTAMGSGAWPELVATLQMTLLGAVVQAATDNASLLALSQQLGDLVDMLLPGDDVDET